MFSLCLKFSPFLFNFIYFFRLFPFISCYICLSHSFDSNAIVVDINFFECVCVSAHKTPNNRNEITSHSRAHLINFSIFYNLLSISNPASSPLDTWVCFDFLILWISYALFSHFFWFFFSLVYQMMFENCRLVHFPRFILRTRTFVPRYVNLQKANRAIEPIPNSFSRIFFFNLFVVRSYISTRFPVTQGNQFDWHAVLSTFDVKLSLFAVHIHNSHMVNTWTLQMIPKQEPNYRLIRNGNSNDHFVICTVLPSIGEIWRIAG